MKRSRKTITIQDVAKAASVSVSTVSRVLNEKDDVAPDTVEKVQGVIRDLGYASSLAARGMRSRRTNVIGMVMPDVASLYCVEIMRGVNQAIARMDYDLMIYTNGDTHRYGAADRERLHVALLNGSLTDGMIVVTPTATQFPTDAPVVIIDPNTESPNCPSVIASNQEGTLAAMAYLTGLGHRRIGLITGRLDLVSANRRLQGYKDGLAAAGIPLDETLIQTGDYTADTAERCTRALLSLAHPPSAIFASNDMSAMGVYAAAAKAGICIPRDLSVIGFDNLHESAFLRPALTTVDQYLEDMGKIATEMVVRLVKGETLQNNLRVLQTHLILRDSCARPA